MAGSADIRSRGRVFDSVAREYDRYRPTYPDELVDRAFEGAGLRAGDPVLEVGCGTGQLTQSLLGRGLQVTAVEPGKRMIGQARERLDGLGEVRFVNSRLEDARLPPGHFRAAFSASAIHWVDPEIGWRRLAGALVAGGSLSLLSMFGLDDPRSRADQDALRGVLAAASPKHAAEWPPYRNLEAIRAGARERRNNISEVWSWLGGYDIGRAHVSELFGTAHLTALQLDGEHTADQVNALLGTMSFWARLSPPERDKVTAGNRSLEQRLGRPIRSSTAACLLIARGAGE